MERDRTLFVKVTRGEQTLVRLTAAATQQKIGEYVRGVLRRHAQEVLGTATTRQIFKETGTDDAS